MTTEESSPLKQIREFFEGGGKTFIHNGQSHAIEGKDLPEFLKKNNLFITEDNKLMKKK